LTDILFIILELNWFMKILRIISKLRKIAYLCNIDIFFIDWVNI
jgi:hypothetical protein